MKLLNPPKWLLEFEDISLFQNVCISESQNLMLGKKPTKTKVMIDKKYHTMI